MGSPKTSEEYSEYATAISQAATGLNEIIRDLLDVGSLASGNFSADLSKKIDAKELIERLVKMNYNFAAKRKILLTKQIDEDSSNQPGCKTHETDFV
ncbi:MAG: hypothetical protein K0R25_897 [Rickettsiaceae bacterium]|jgi:signal transduction histidine kinase|nr:hypothetical protein [Rickettsiaceae bacterium]